MAKKTKVDDNSETPKVVDDNDSGPEVLASAIQEVAAAARKLLGSRLTKRAVLVLIQDEIGGRTVSLQTISTVLDSASRLESTYVKRGS